MDTERRHHRDLRAGPVLPPTCHVFFLDPYTIASSKRFSSIVNTVDRKQPFLEALSAVLIFASFHHWATGPSGLRMTLSGEDQAVFLLKKPNSLNNLENSMELSVWARSRSPSRQMEMFSILPPRGTCEEFRHFQNCQKPSAQSAVAPLTSPLPRDVAYLSHCWSSKCLLSSLKSKYMMSSEAEYLGRDTAIALNFM